MKKNEFPNFHFFENTRKIKIFDFRKNQIFRFSIFKKSKFLIFEKSQNFRFSWDDRWNFPIFLGPEKNDVTTLPLLALTSRRHNSLRNKPFWSRFFQNCIVSQGGHEARKIRAIASVHDQTSCTSLNFLFEVTPVSRTGFWGSELNELTIYICKIRILIFFILRKTLACDQICI